MNLGLGVMISKMSTSDAQPLIDKFKDRIIQSVVLDKGWNVDGGLLIGFGTETLVLFDDGRSCCETRYMSTDDQLSDFVGAKFFGVRVRGGKQVEEEYEHKENMFLLIDTSKGTFTCETHNEHNGYYGGFALIANVITK